LNSWKEFLYYEFRFTRNTGGRKTKGGIELSEDYTISVEMEILIIT